MGVDAETGSEINDTCFPHESDEDSAVTVDTCDLCPDTRRATVRERDRWLVWYIQLEDKLISITNEPERDVPFQVSRKVEDLLMDKIPVCAKKRRWYNTAPKRKWLKENEKDKQEMKRKKYLKVVVPGIQIRPTPVPTHTGSDDAHPTQPGSAVGDNDGAACARELMRMARQEKQKRAAVK